MKNHDLIEELSRLLDLDTQESGRLLNGFFTAMVTELLAVRKLAVKGLGSFTVVHVPLKKISNASGITYSPPSNRLTYDRNISRADDTARIASSRLMLNTAEAERLGRALATVFSRAVQQQREIRIPGLGRFSKEQGTYGFIPERSLEELLNREYHNMDDVVLPWHETEQVRKKLVKSRYSIALSFLVFNGLLLAVYYYGKPEAIVPVAAIPHRESKIATVVQKERVRVKPQPAESVTVKGLSGGVATDSLVLEKGEYTIVLETFRSERTALEELARLHAEGITAYLWPAYLKKMKYYRLMTSKFADRDEAVKHLKSMPKKITGTAYIQHVSKKGVYYGQKGL